MVFTYYKEGESTFTVKTNAYSYKHGDGSGSSHTFSPQLRTVTVMTSRGDVDMQMYIVDDDSAIRAVQYPDGHYSIHHYVENIDASKYIHVEFFNLR